ncbi:MAG: NAD(P)/FAD-dependent oxidoreductase [Candidatus Sifarchaeia archaeon]
MVSLTYDVIVVGAGPAGSIAAHDCAKQGFKTLLLEKYRLPREKPCGGAVMYRGLRLIDGKLPQNLVERRIFGLRFLLPDGRQTEFVSDKLIGITVFRDRFDEFLAKRASDAGAELLDNSPVVDASVSLESAIVRVVGGTEFKAKYLVGADGVNSIVSRALGLRPKRKELTKVGLGMEADFYVGEKGVLEATGGNPTVLEVCPVEGRVSYGWVFPKREHLAIGIAGPGVHMQALRPRFDSFYKSVEKRIGVGLKLEKRRTYFLGGDGLGSKNVTQRAILIGDAAGFVDPLMGEGIAYAMKSGEFAASIINNAFTNDRYDEEILSGFQDLCIKEFSANFALATRVGVRGPSLAEFILPRVNGHRLASEIMTMVARGEIGYADIPYILLRRLPREFPTIMKQIVHSHFSLPS